MVNNAAQVTKSPRPKAGVNHTVTWGELFLILNKYPQDPKRGVMEKIIEIDSRA